MGFPTRPSRLAFGSLAYQNRLEVTEPDKEIDAPIFNLSFWQIAGCGLVVPVAVAGIEVDSGGTESILFAGEAWDPGGGVDPTLSKVATGRFKLVYDASYPDETGLAITTNLVGGKAWVMDTATAQVLYFPQVEILADRRSAEVRVRNTSFALADPVSQIVLVDLY